MPILAFTLLPEIDHNVEILDRLKIQHPLIKHCEHTPSSLHQRLTWLNRVVTTLFLAKFFKVYYGATWNSELPDGSNNADTADYWLVLTYLWSNWWSKYDALGHKVHLIEHMVHRHDAHGVHNVGQLSLQDQLAATYRKIQSEDFETLLPLTTWIHGLRQSANQSGKNPDQNAMAMMAIVARLLPMANWVGHMRGILRPRVLIVGLSCGHSRPWSALPRPATTVAPFACLGAYLRELCSHSPWCTPRWRYPDTNWHGIDDHMDREPDAWVYGLITAAYTAVTGWYTGPTWGRNLWCRWHGADPTHFERDLAYWPQNLAGLRAIFGGGLTYLGASLLMFPIAGLASEQLYDIEAPMWLQKAQLATIALWGVVLDASFVGPHYQNVIGHLGRLIGADPKGTLKDDLLKLIVNLHQGVGRLDHEHSETLTEVLNTLPQTPSGEVFCDTFDSPSDSSFSSLSSDSGSDDTSPSPDTGRLDEPLLSDSPSYVPEHKLNIFQKARNWLVGEPIPHDLRAELAKAYSPG